MTMTGNFVKTDIVFQERTRITSTTFASILLKKLDLHLDKKASQLKHNPPVGGSLNLGVSTIRSMRLGQSEEIKDVFVESDVQN